MHTKKAKLGILMLSSSLILLACGNTDVNTDTDTDPSTSSVIMSEEMSSENSMSSTSMTTESSSESTTIQSESASTSKGIADTEFDISMEQAVNTFKDTFPDAEITSIAIDNDSDSYVYELEGYNDSNSVEIKVDAYSGEIVKQKDTEDREDNAEDDVLDLEGIISPQEAMRAALDEVGSGYAKEWEIDSKNGKLYYEIDVEDAEQENDDVHIDAKTGEFIGYD